MLVLEFELDDKLIDIKSKDNPWLTRAAQSFAEAMRLAATHYLDVEFSELVTGYRLRKNPLGTFVDVYLYDSLSSGAGYAVRVAEDIGDLFVLVERILESCTCNNSCHNCLRNYRNQHVHGQLDRFAALELLRWGKYGNLAADLDYQKQKNLILPFQNILERSCCRINYINNQIMLTKGNITKKLVIYPAMREEIKKSGTIFVSDALLKYAKPYALRKIIEEM